MKKFMCSSALALVSIFAYADETSYFRYGDVHSLGGYPMVGVGFRSQKGLHALDISGNICILNGLTPLIYHVKGLYLLFPQQRGFYLGGGLGLLNEPESLKKFSGSLEGALGYQWEIADKSSFFLEVNVTIPFREPQGALRAWPCLTFGFGF